MPGSAPRAFHRLRRPRGAPCSTYARRAGRDDDAASNPAAADDTSSTTRPPTPSRQPGTGKLHKRGAELLDAAGSARDTDNAGGTTQRIWPTSPRPGNTQPTWRPRAFSPQHSAEAPRRAAPGSDEPSSTTTHPQRKRPGNTTHSIPAMRPSECSRPSTRDAGHKKQPGNPTCRHPRPPTATTRPRTAWRDHDTPIRTNAGRDAS